MNNGSQNSRIEILLGVVRNLLDDIADLTERENRSEEVPRCPFNIRKECDRDYAYISSRTLSEGLSFLAVQLPRLGKWYDNQMVEPDNGDLIVGFKPYHKFAKANLSCPLFCRMYMWWILNVCDEAPEKARVMRAYRSLFYLYYKLEVPFTQLELAKALIGWKINESELENHEFPDYFDSELIIAREIISDMFNVRTTRHVFTDISPRHGPGAVAGGERGDEKWANAHIFPSLHSVYPQYDLYFGYRSSGRISATMCGEILAFRKRSSKKDKAVSRLLFVPKDSRGPRTISCEPKELMFVQQGVARNLMRLLHTASYGRINFIDQSINGNLALTSSVTQEYATVDLKDASDKVSTKLVQLVFPDWTHKYLLALRSSSTMLPDGSVFDGHLKYAPMGSALCFPVESVIFWALAVTAGVKAGMSMEAAKASTYVYGDDIIIPPQNFGHMCRLFTRVGLKVNIEKSFVDGPFRESCGVDAFTGFNITPFKIKKDISRRSLDGTLATAICKYASTCFALDFRRTGEFLYNLVNERYPGVVRTDRPIGCLHVIDELCVERYNVPVHWSIRSCCCWLEGWVLKTPSETSTLSGLSRLLKNQYGHWEEYDPSQVAVLSSAKIRKRKVLVEMVY